MIKLYETAFYVFVQSDEKQVLEKIIDEFAFQPPNFWRAPSYERFVVSKGKEGWDGFLRPFSWHRAGLLRALRGRKADVIRWAEENEEPADKSGLLPLPFAHLTEDDIRPDLIAGEYELDDNQRRCILGWLQHGIGINQVVVSGGKTAAFAGAAAYIKQHYPEESILYLTPSERLVRQSTQEMRRMLPTLDIGQFGGGRDQSDAKDMVVATVAMLNRHFLDLTESNFFKRFLAVFYDECHHAHSASSRKILEQIPAYFRFGASDTTKENDEQKWNDIRGLFGPVYNVVHAAPLIAVGRIAKPHIYIQDLKPWANKFEFVDHDPMPGTSAFVLVDDTWKRGTYLGSVYEKDDEGEIVTRDYKTAEKDEDGKWIVEKRPVIVPGLHRIQLDGVEHEIASTWCLLHRLYDRAIIQFTERNNLIVKWARYYSNRGLPTVIVCTRTLHVYILESLLIEAIDPNLVDILVGKDTPKARDNCFAWFKKTPGAVLITPLVKEGVSIREIRAGIVADYVADHEVARQILGRFIRQKLTQDNRAEITWFRDRQHPTLRRGCNRVFQQLQQIEGYTFHDPAPDLDALARQAGLSPLSGSRSSAARR